MGGWVGAGSVLWQGIAPAASPSFLPILPSSSLQLLSLLPLLPPSLPSQAGMNLVDAAKAAGVKHFVYSSLEDTRPALELSRQPLQGSYTVPHFDAKAEVEAYAREKVGSAAGAGWVVAVSC